MKVRSLDLGPLTTGDHDVAWDGLNSNGVQVDDGTYSYNVVASGNNGESIDMTPFLQGRVTGVTFDQYGIPTLKINDMKISIPDVVEIMAEPVAVSTDA